MKLKYLAISLSMLFSASALANHVSNSFYTFGDSLSDGGASGPVFRFIANDNSQLYNEILAEHYTGEKQEPFTINNGKNYAEAGATAASQNSGLLRTDLQIGYYLSQNGGKADKDGMYNLWIGANDISYDVLNSLKALNFSGLFNEGDHYLLSNAPQAVADQTKTLLDAGAGYVIVPTIPHAGLAPWTATALLSVFDIFRNSPYVSRLYSELDTALRNHGAIASEEERQQAISDALTQVLHANGLPISSVLIEKAYHMVLGLENRLTDQFNNDTEAGLAALTGNIVRPDISKLFNEIIISPKMYGFDDVLVPICQIGVGAAFCKEGSPSWHDDKVYMFSDWYHPSPEAHAVIAQYMISVLDAPLYAASLRKALEGMNDEHRLFLDGQLQQLRSTPDDQKVIVFGGYSGKYRDVKGGNDAMDGRDHSNNGELGFAIQAVPGWMVGGTLSAGNSAYHISDDYSYNYRGKVMSLFSQVMLNSGLWGNIDTHFGDTSLTDIRRSIALGKGTRVETGSSNASNFGVSLNVGYDFKFASNFSTGPVLGYSWDKYKIDAYREQGDSSTSMHFGEQRQEMSVGRAGWRLDTNDLPVNPYLEVTWNRNFNDDAAVVSGAVNSTRTSFTRTGDKPQKQWTDVKVGASTKFTDNLGMFGNVSYSNGTHGTNDVYYSLGINYRF